MFDLALYAQQVPQPIKAIAEREGIPEAYLEQLIAGLRKGELVTSVRGAQGGYMLARPADQITVGNVLRTLEGDLSIVSCLAGEDVCAKSGGCPTRAVWQKLRDGINQVVDSITLQDMLDDYERMNAQGEQ